MSNSRSVERVKLFSPLLAKRMELAGTQIWATRTLTIRSSALLLGPGARDVMWGDD